MKKKENKNKKIIKMKLKQYNKKIKMKGGKAI